MRRERDNQWSCSALVITSRPLFDLPTSSRDGAHRSFYTYYMTDVSVRVSQENAFTHMGWARADSAFYSASVAEHCVTPLLAEEDELTQAMPHCTDRSDPTAGLPDGMNETHMLEAPRDVKEDRAARSRYGVE
ncbi:uncharacterized protein RAG0_01558 [Rhynchosporium agropyri]|uniref:Uncharacterized protein n=1 Tax=Rhynchosporium agropyri TaxID=914238 RepID=A0A1E1JXW4_9HELO|nr:uncharacterized protein RAG0_01558 [Rhynchosporium agropyri]